MRIETDSDYYYDVLNIYERIRAEILKKHSSIYKAVLSIGKSKGYLYTADTVGSVQNLNKLCEKFDLDFDYILLGGKNQEKYSKKEINLKKLFSVKCSL